MNQKLITPIALFFSLFGIFSCNNSEGVMCTEIFITQDIEIQGKKLDKCYTLRLSNNDTIRIEQYDSTRYAVLNDMYRNNIANTQDSFHFVGLINDSIVVVEPFVFGADDCHIHKVSGKEQIQL